MPTVRSPLFRIVGTVLLVMLVTVAMVIMPRRLSDDMIADLSSLAPDSVDRWMEEAGSDAVYDRETIFDYMNGAGEVYLSFSYREMFVRRYAGPTGEELTLEIYDMGSSSDAFGIFSRARQEDDIGIGQGSEYRSGYLNFWKGRFFITAYTYDENEDSRAALLALGRSIASAIPETGPPPEIVDCLPTGDLLPNTIRYFHLHTDLNRHYFVADENILDLDPEVDAVIASYEREDDYSYLLIVAYPSEERAQTAHRTFADIYMPEAAATGVTQIEDGSWTAAIRTGMSVAVVFDASTADRARQLLADARARMEGAMK